MGYPFIFNLKDEEHKTKILTKKDIEENKIFLSKLVKVINDLELKRVGSDAVICKINKNYIKS